VRRSAATPNKAKVPYNRRLRARGIHFPVRRLEYVAGADVSPPLTPREAAACATQSELVAHFRRSGLYSSQLSNWRKEYEIGGMSALEEGKRGRKPVKNPLDEDLFRLYEELTRIKTKLQHAERTMYKTNERTNPNVMKAPDDRCMDSPRGNYVFQHAAVPGTQRRK
jgi:hypothetical protein